MKIIHIILGKANPNRMNGVNKVVYNLANSQATLGCDVSVWGITKTPNASTINDNLFKIELLQQRPFWKSIDSKIYQLLSNIKGNCIFHFHGGFIPEFYKISRILNSKELNYVLTSHGAYNTIAMKKSRWLKYIYTFIAEQKLIKSARHLHFIGASEYHATEARFPNLPKIIIPNGQNLIITQKPKLQSIQEPIFGFMGRLNTNTKGLDLLLRGYEQYVKKYQGIADLHIMGDGKDLNSLKKQVHRMGLNNKVVFLGALYGTEKLEALNKMHAFLHPSRYEGLPGAVLEAASLGIPCIVSKETNMYDYISNYRAGIGLLRNNKDHIALALKKMQELLYKRFYYTMQINAQKMIEKEFDWQEIARKHYKSYPA